MKHDDLYMRIVDVIAQQSQCERLKVGALIVRDENIVSFGWNGTPPGFPNPCEDEHFATRELVIHAESNALAKAARSTVSTKGATLYLTHSPCWNCALQVLQAGISRVVFRTMYREEAPISMLKEAGVEVVCL